jgi:NAD(P)-dependent dehydrogenase (short-subunit alcohol dehydrogenase family)
MTPPPPRTAYFEELFGLSGRTAVIIGGGGSLGGAMAEALASAGADVLIAGRDAAAGQAVASRILTAGGRCEYCEVDAVERASLEALRTRLIDEGRVCHVLVNAAGVNSATPFLQITDEEWDRILNVNLRAVRLACQVFGQQMLDAHVHGSIINIASLSALTPLSRVFTYSVSKAGVLNLTINLAREWGPLGIRVNALSPGFFPAEQNRKVLTSERQASILAHTPMGRFGTPHELAGATLLLASPKAGAFITGANLVVDGGFMSQTI